MVVEDDQLFDIYSGFLKILKILGFIAKKDTFSRKKKIF